MDNIKRFTSLVNGGEFHFQRLSITGIQNEPVFAKNSPKMREEEICLFHNDFSSGDEYLDCLHREIADAISKRVEKPVARFADGEYAFYGFSLKCNGLYRQAESRRAIRKSMPDHLTALRRISDKGKIAPLVFPGNIGTASEKWTSFFSKGREFTSSQFLEYLFRNGIELNKNNYIPFYAIYAYLTSKLFSQLVDGKKVCIINSEFHQDSCRDWFARRFSWPVLSFLRIPDSHVATRWPLIEADIISQVPFETDICLIGAGIGALQVAVSISRSLSIPSIDAGHVLNMMNGREDKSNGARLYTIWKK